MKFTCPHCDQSLETETLYKGSGTVCPNCGGDLTIPDANISTPPESEQPEPEEVSDPKEDFRMDFTAAKKVIQDNLKNDSLSLHQALTAKGIQQEDIDLDKTASGTLASSPTDRYVIGDAITQGGMGAILDVKDVNVRRNVAMKVILRPEQASKEDILRFVREGQVLGQLEHPGIVPLHEVGVDAAGNPFFTMKKVVGLNLGEILRKLADGHKKTIKDYPLSHLLNIFQRVCDAIAFAHSKRVIHRDLKPENIMIGEYGEVLVIDWGIAKILSRDGKSSATQDLTDTGRSERVKAFIDSVQSDDSGVAIKTLDGELMGTPRFMAPEQATGELSKVDDCTDIYALGAILYNILTLHPPITGENLDEMLKNVSTGKIKHPSSYNTKKKGKAAGKKPQAVVLPHCPGRKIPDALGAVAMKALSLKPKDRYQYVKFLQRDLEAYQTGFATSVEDVNAWKQVKLFVRRNKGITVTAVVAASLLLSMGVSSYVVNLKALRNAKEALAKYEVEKEHRQEDRATSAPNMLRSAKSLAEQGKFKDAKDRLRKAIDYDPDLLTARRLLAILLLRDKDYVGAVKVSKALLKREPDDKGGRSLLKMSEAASKKGDSVIPFGKLGASVAKQGMPLLAAALTDDAEGMLEFYRQKMAEVWTGFDGKRLSLTVQGDLSLSLLNTKVTNLEPLRGMPLKYLNIASCSGVTDLSPLKGMPLVRLDLHACKGITDLSPLEGMPLEWLDIYYTRVTDLSPLKGMPLTYLVIWITGVSDLSPLKGMPLTTLNPAQTAISDLSPLAGMKLTKLSLKLTKVTDLSPLKGMRLTSLNLGRTKVIELSPLKDMKSLTVLDLSNTGIGDLSPLKGMPLTSLNLAACASIDNLSPLKGMPLASLNLTACGGIVDLSPLKGMPLASLFLQQTGAKDLSPLRGMRLTNLNLYGAKASDLSPLKGMPLTALNLAYARATDLSPLKGMPLTTLFLYGTKVTDLSPLKGMPLTTLFLYGTKVTDLTPLKGMDLTRLRLDGSPVKDLTPLKGMPLVYLLLNDTKVSDLAPLASMPLQTFFVSRTPVQDLTPLQGSPLSQLVFSPESVTNGIDAIRGIKTLTRINNMSAADFWKRYDAGEFKKK